MCLRYLQLAGLDSFPPEPFLDERGWVCVKGFHGFYQLPLLQVRQSPCFNHLTEKIAQNRKTKKKNSPLEQGLTHTPHTDILSDDLSRALGSMPYGELITTLGPTRLKRSKPKRQIETEARGSAPCDSNWDSKWEPWPSASF